MIRGHFVHQGVRYPATLRLIHQTGSLIGCALDGAEASQIREMVKKYFEIELSAENMVEVDPLFLPEEQDGRPRRFCGRDGFELFLVENAAEQVVYFYVSFMGNFLEFGRGVTLRFGNRVKEDTPGSFRHKSSEFIRFFSKVPPEGLEMAVRLVESIEGLEQKTRQQVLGKLKN